MSNVEVLDLTILSCSSLYTWSHTVCVSLHESFLKYYISKLSVSWKILLLSPAFGRVPLSVYCAILTSLRLFSAQRTHHSFETDVVGFLMVPPREKGKGFSGAFVLLKWSLEDTSTYCKCWKSQLFI